MTSQNPFEIFADWFDEAKKNPSVNDHTEMCLATADKNGRPSARMVLLKEYDAQGFVFYTNYGGRKSIEITQNPHAALCIYWNALGKQIRVEGKVEKTSAAESDNYFNSRARESRIGAITSKQSQELGSREKLLEEIHNNEIIFEDKQITRPENWGGWRIIPERIEFWHAGEFRIHDRVVFERSGNEWRKKLLYP